MTRAAAVLALCGALACTGTQRLPQGQRSAPLPRDALLLVPARTPAVLRVRPRELGRSELRPHVARLLDALVCEAGAGAPRAPFAIDAVDELVVAAELDAHDGAPRWLAVARGDFATWNAQRTSERWSWDARGAWRLHRTTHAQHELLVLDAQHIACVDRALVGDFLEALAEPRRSLLHRDGVARVAASTRFREASAALFARVTPEQLARMKRSPSFTARLLAPSLGHLDALSAELHVGERAELNARAHAGTEAFSAFAPDALRPHLDAFASASRPELRALWSVTQLASDRGDLTLRWSGTSVQLAQALAGALPE